jgi:hypothetical protein
MALLHAGVDISVIALWLGTESTHTQIYLHADMSIKERALARTALPGSPPGRYTARHTAGIPPDTLTQPVMPTTPAQGTPPTRHLATAVDITRRSA